MPALTNPSEIARETLRQLAGQRMPPTPDNFKTLYHEISGTKSSDDGFPETHLRSLISALPLITPDQLRVARDLEAAVKASDWEAYRNRLSEFVTNLAEAQKLAWSELIGNLIRNWEAKQSGITPARKRESLDHVLASAGANPETLYNRLQRLVSTWSGGKGAEMAFDGEIQTEAGSSETADSDAAPTASPAAAPGQDLMPEMREVFAFTLETAITSQLNEAPVLAEEAKMLADEIRRVSDARALQNFMARLKRFAFKIDLFAEDNQNLRRSLMSVLQLLVENMSDLVMDDRWLSGQIEMVREVIQQPLSQRSVNDVERRVKEVLFKQSQLKQSLVEAREALKSMLTGFVDHLAAIADTTSDYHDIIEACATKISAANDVASLEAVIAEVMRETRNMQLNAQRSRDELRATQERVTEKETRIRELERELEQASEQVRHDQLTGAVNRRGLEEIFERETARAQRHDSAMCLALLDIDNFKKLNDTLGHDAGDQALIHLARVCRDTMRPHDTVARFGGEEFVILLPDTNLTDATTALTRLQRELTKRFFLHNNEKTLITFSAGVTELRPDDNQASVIKRADEAMYKAKKSGKNRVEAG